MTMDDVVKSPAVTTTFTIYTDCCWGNNEYVEKELNVKYLALIQNYIVTDKAYDALLMKIDFDGYAGEAQSQHPYYDTLALLEEELEGIKEEVYDTGIVGNRAKNFFRSTWRFKDVPTLQLSPEEDEILTRIPERMPRP
jgi:hypothetical protein